MATQYDSIGKRYATMNEIPAKDVEKPSVLHILGDVRGLRCLDLACGLGRWSQVLLEHGAAHVTGIDISEEMIRAAQTDLPVRYAAQVQFMAQDCSKPFVASQGPFDLVLAVWFFNYASSYEDMLMMWTNIYANLKPGGRLVALTTNTFCGTEIPIDPKYGITERLLRTTGDRGWQCKVTALVDPPVEFDCYHYSHELYERAAGEAGMEDLAWRSHVIPHDGRPDGFWDVYNLRPHQSICTAMRPA